jgi:hypothetical protein
MLFGPWISEVSTWLIRHTWFFCERKKEAQEVKDFRPISPIHSFSKLITKILSLRLDPFIDDLIMPNLSAFIKGRAIHDNFITVQSTVKYIHAQKQSCCLLKVDMSKAFDAVSWAFLLDLLSFMGFPRHWTDWISTLVSTATASTWILLNSIPGHHICHAWGLSGMETPCHRSSCYHYGILECLLQVGYW